MIFETYNQELRSVEGITIPVARSYTDPMWHLYALHVNASIRKKVFSSMREMGIGVQVNYIPAYWHPVFQNLGFKKGMFPISDSFYEGEISMPIYSNLSMDLVVEISSKLKSLF